MLVVLGLMAAVWLLGRVFGTRPAVRLQAVAAIWLVAGAVFALAGDRLAGLRGADLRSWAATSVLFLLVGVYDWGLRWLRRRAAPVVAAVVPAAVPAAVPAVVAEPARPGKFSEAELDRYARHILLREIGGPGQRKLRDASVLVVGAGGLGSPALLYLAASGVGRLVVVDDDAVDASNLQRQVIHTTDRVGVSKVESARVAIAALNPFVAVETHPVRLTEENAAGLIGAVDLVLDGSDNFDTRYLVNKVCTGLGKPLIAAAITQWEGQMSLYDPARGTPCYECVFPVRPAPGMVPTCAEAGVAAPLPGILGSMMAMEAVKHLTGAGETYRGRLMVFDALYGETRVFEIEKRADCPVCGKPH
jgi:molybdopterin/thiamine biosynthesis adenylyltransferase